MILPDSGKELHLDIFKLSSTSANLASIENDIRKCITANVTNIGPYIHGNRFTAFIRPPGESMEFEGGVNSGIGELEHEVFHNWFGRGVKPATQNDGWIDEALAMYYTGPDYCAVKPFDMSEPVIVLSPNNPFNRAGCGAAYTAGPRFFAGLAAAVGLENLRSYISSFYKENCGHLITTRQLEAYLINKSGKKELADYFKRFVYGLKDIEK
ncbi:M1 family metallopeptidase [Candidatus Poribacteria bacterium]|nr:M1 family metallopeptidase [Candidatus Poribacteria bacterium]